METNNKQTIEKILGDALELREKGISLHSILNTYPEHKSEIEEMFGSIGILATEREAIRVSQDAFERMLASLPFVEGARQPVRTPFWSTMHYSNWKYVLPIAAVAILTGGLFISRHESGNTPIDVPSAPLAPLTNPVNDTTQINPAGTAKTTSGTAGATPMAMMASAPSSNTDRVVAMLTQDSGNESTFVSTTADEKTVISSNAGAMSDPLQSYENNL